MKLSWRYMCMYLMNLSKSFYIKINRQGSSQSDKHSIIFQHFKNFHYYNFLNSFKCPFESEIPRFKAVFLVKYMMNELFSRHDVNTEL